MSARRIGARVAAIDRRLATLAFAAFATGTESYVYAGHLGALAHELEIGLAEAGMLAASFALTYALSAPILASMLARIDRRTLIVAGLFGIGMFNLAAAASPNFAVLLALRVACGLAAGLVGPASSAVAATLAPPDRRGQAMAVVMAGLTLAFILGIPLGSVIGAAGGWRATFVFAGTLALVAAFLTQMVLPQVPGSPSAGLGRLLAGLRPDVLATLMLTGIGFAATFTVIAYIAPVAMLIADVEGEGVGGLQALIGVGSIIGIAIGGSQADRPDSLRLVMASFGVSALALSVYSGLVGAGPNHPFTLPVLSLAMIAGAAALFARAPVIQARLVRLDPKSTNVLLALNGSMVFAGQGLGAAIGAAVTAALGTHALGYSAAVVALVGVALCASLLRDRARTPT